MSSEIVQVTTNRGRYYKWDGQFYKSVTTILNATIPMPWLAAWKVKLVAEKAIDLHPVLGDLIERGETIAAIDMLKKTADRFRDEAGDRGSTVHDAVEQIAKGLAFTLGDWPEETQPYIQGFIDFCEENKPEFTALESTIASRQGMYAGMVDFRCIVRKKACTFDTKTSKNLSNKFELQVSAYNNAEFTVEQGIEKPWEPTPYCYVLHLKPNGVHKVVQVDGSIDTFEVFLACRKLFDWIEAN